MAQVNYFCNKEHYKCIYQLHQTFSQRYIFSLLVGLAPEVKGGIVVGSLAGGIFIVIGIVALVKYVHTHTSLNQ